MNSIFNEEVKKIVNLVEERGVAAFPYKNAATQILKYCQNQAKELKIGDEINFSIPKELTSKINFVEDLEINVTIKDGENYAYNTGGGNLNIKIDDELIDGKYNKALININAYSYYGKLYDKTILNSLYHELNHLYEAWKELTRDGNMYTAAIASSRGGRRICSLPSPYKEYVNVMLYRLFSQTELNALISSVYGDLEGIKSERINFNEDIFWTSAYDFYLLFQEQLNEINLFLKENPQYIRRFFNELNAKGVIINPYYKNDNGYLKEFNRKVKFYLKTLIRGIGKVASLYYDNKEVPEDNINIKID